MIEGIAQISAIVTSANNFLIYNKLEENFFEKTCFQNCSQISFIEHNKVHLAGSPSEWFKLLKKEGCKSVMAQFDYNEFNKERPDHFTEGIFGGGVKWRFESLFEDHSRYWTATWRYEYPYRRSQKYYEIIYRRQFKKYAIDNEQLHFEDLKKQLGSVLWELSEFAKKSVSENWMEYFNLALEKLYDSDPSKNIFYNDIIPKEKYSLSEIQLYYGAIAAWCFGQKGSWNDLTFKEKITTERYLSLTSQLYDILLRSIKTIINKQ